MAQNDGEHPVKRGRHQAPAVIWIKKWSGGSRWQLHLLHEAKEHIHVLSGSYGEV